MGAEIEGPEMEELEQITETNKPIENNQIMRIGESINLDQVLSLYQNRVLIENSDEIAKVFEENGDKKSICLEIIIHSTEEDDIRGELALVHRELLRAAYKYTGLSDLTPIGFDIKGILAEMIGDVDKHARPNSSLNRIYFRIGKDGSEISFHIINPANSNVDLTAIDSDYKPDSYDIPSFGQDLARGLEQDLVKNGCREVSDESHIVIDSNNNKIGVGRDANIVIPEQ